MELRLPTSAQTKPPNVRTSASTGEGFETTIEDTPGQNRLCLKLAMEPVFFVALGRVVWASLIENSTPSRWFSSCTYFTPSEIKHNY
jgi:hypothetical protein